MAMRSNENITTKLVRDMFALLQLCTPCSQRSTRRFWIRERLQFLLLLAVRKDSLSQKSKLFSIIYATVESAGIVSKLWNYQKEKNAEPVNHLKYFVIKLIQQLKHRRSFNLSRNLYFVCQKKMHISYNPLKKKLFLDETCQAIWTWLVTQIDI